MRLQWTSEEAKSEWAPKVRGIQSMIHYLEIQSVLSGQRKGALFSAPPNAGVWTEFKGLNVMPMGIAKNEDYNTSAVFPKEGEPYVIRALISKDGIVAPMDDRAWGAILGYPQCCIDFFMDFWVKKGLRDPLTTITSDPQPLAKFTNVALRAIGVRPVFHLPCSPDCKGTVEVARGLRILATTGGFNESVESMDRLLTMPFSVSTKNGVAEILHPLFRACYQTDPGARTVHFTDKSVRKENGFDLFWKDNGFNNIFDMERAHQEIINRVVLLEGIESIVDLGAGNGYLASKLGKLVGALSTYAVEAVQEKVIRGRAMFPDVRFVNNNIGAQNTPADLVLISDKRFEEGLAEGVVEADAKKYLVVYSYDGGLRKNGDFKGFHLLSSSKNVVVHRRTA